MPFYWDCDIISVTVTLMKGAHMYYDFTVPIPQIRGKIITKKKGTAKYILYQYGQTYNKEKKYAVPKRSIIGKVSNEDPSQMYPNEKFQQYFPDIVFPEELPEASRSCCLRIGSYAVIKKVMDEYGIPRLLKKWLGKDAGLFMDLVSYMIVDEQNAGQYYPDFAFSHPLFSEGMKIFSDSKVSRMLSSMGREKSLGFLSDWNRKRDHKQRIYISYDSTNKNCQAGDIDIVEFGKAKDDKGIPIFNVSLAFDKTNRIPLFYEEYPGSITDVSQFKYMVDKSEEFGYKKLGFILDRGYFSKSNIQYMDERGYEFVIMVRGNRELVSSVIRDHKNTFETDRSCSIRAYRVYGTTIRTKLYSGDSKDRYFHLYYNPYKQAAEREILEQKIDRYHRYLEKHIGDRVDFSRTYKEYFELIYDKDHKLVGIAERENVVQRQLELCGYFCIISSEKMTAEQALIRYKGRDASEKLFSADKSFLGSRSMRVQSEEAVSAKIFIEFTALIVRNRIYNLLKETMLRLEKTPNFMTVPAAIRELEKIEMIKVNQGRYRLDHAVTKKQKIILSSFGMDEDDIRRTAAEISQLLEKNQSMMDRETEDESDGENEIDNID